MYKRFLSLPALMFYATLSVAQPGTTLFWQSCMLTESYKSMVDTMTASSKSAAQCRTERDTAQLSLVRIKAELDSTAAALARAKAELESNAIDLGKGKSELESVKQEIAAAVALGERNLRNALRGPAMTYRYIKSARAAECPAVLEATFRASSVLTSVSATNASVSGTSATCGAKAWCSPATDKDGDRYIIFSAVCVEGSGSALLDELSKAADHLR
jgi:hypothetical protein